MRHRQRARALPLHRTQPFCRIVGTGLHSMTMYIIAAPKATHHRLRDIAKA